MGENGLELWLLEATFIGQPVTRQPTRWIVPLTRYKKTHYLTKIVKGTMKPNKYIYLFYKYLCYLYFINLWEKTRLGHHKLCLIDISLFLNSWAEIVIYRKQCSGKVYGLLSKLTDRPFYPHNRGKEIERLSTTICPILC